MQDTRATTRWPTRWPQVSIYEKMLALIGPNAPPFARAAFLDELNIAGHGCDEPADFFHVVCTKSLFESPTEHPLSTHLPTTL